MEATALLAASSDTGIPWSAAISGLIILLLVIVTLSFRGIHSDMNTMRSDAQTKHTELIGAITNLDTKMTGEFKAVRAEMTGMHTALTGQINTLSARMEGEFNTVNTKVDGLDKRVSNLEPK